MSNRSASDDHIHAVLDVGSNTIRLLVGRVSDGAIERILDRSEFVRLGKGVDESGNLQPDREEAGIQAIRELATEAERHGAAGITAIATSAVRDAANGDAFVRRVREETGVAVTIISGQREAELTFRGASSGLDLDAGAIVCDLGGGSAELIYAGPAGVLWATSVKLGSGRLTERFVKHDPPEPQEMRALEGHVQAVLDDLQPAMAHLAVFTGGTASHIAMLAGLQDTIVHLDPAMLHGIVTLLTSKPAAQIVAQYGVREERARVLPAGVGAVTAISTFYSVPEIVITQSGIREGALLDAADSRR